MNIRIIRKVPKKFTGLKQLELKSIQQKNTFFMIVYGMTKYATLTPKQVYTKSLRLLTLPPTHSLGQSPK